MRELTEGARLVGRYTLQRPAGSGGMATLWLARDTRSDSPVVLKFLAAQLAGSARRREQFQREWQIASRLMHAHIVRVFEYHDDAEGPFYAQQFIDGPALAVLAGQPLDQLLRPLGLLADALRYAHAKNIVHGDITAANVLLDGRGAPYLLDFG
ncbi:MAG: protein kinase, partial [Woeseia sp.]